MFFRVIVSPPLWRYNYRHRVLYTQRDDHRDLFTLDDRITQSYLLQSTSTNYMPCSTACNMWTNLFQFFFLSFSPLLLRHVGLHLTQPDGLLKGCVLILYILDGFCTTCCSWYVNWRSATWKKFSLAFKYSGESNNEHYIYGTAWVPCASSHIQFQYWLNYWHNL